MRKFFSQFFASVAIVCGLASSATAATITGSVALRISGSLRGALSPNGQVTCSGAVALAPDTTAATLTVANIAANLLSKSAVQTGGVGATLNATRNGFGCIVTLPYNFLNVNPGQKLIVTIDVRGSDPGFVNPMTGAYTPPATIPGRTRQVVTILDAVSQTIVVPPAPQTLAVKL